MPDLRSIQTEVDASYLYSKLVEKEENKNVADIFQQIDYFSDRIAGLRFQACRFA